MNFSRFFVILSLCFFTSAALLMWQRVRPARLAFDTSITPVGDIEMADTTPVHIHIDSMSISLPISPASISAGAWQTTTTGVSYLRSTPVPGAEGNSVLYGHNWPNLLGPITDLRPGDTFSVLYDNGIWRDFIIQYTTTVTPDQTKILQPSQNAQVTLYTCTGFLDSKRFVIVAIPSNTI